MIRQEGYTDNFLNQVNVNQVNFSCSGKKIANIKEVAN